MQSSVTIKHHGPPRGLYRMDLAFSNAGLRVRLKHEPLHMIYAEARTHGRHDYVTAFWWTKPRSKMKTKKRTTMEACPFQRSRHVYATFA